MASIKSFHVVHANCQTTKPLDVIFISLGDSFFSTQQADLFEPPTHWERMYLAIVTAGKHLLCLQIWCDKWHCWS